MHEAGTCYYCLKEKTNGFGLTNSIFVCLSCASIHCRPYIESCHKNIPTDLEEVKRVDLGGQEAELFGQD